MYTSLCMMKLSVMCMQALLPSLDYTARIYAMWRICRGKAWFIFICVLNFFHVRLPSGAEYLLIARDEADLLAWVDAINKAIQNQTTMNPLSQSGHFCELTNLGGRRYLPYFSCSPIPIEPSDICNWAWSLIWDGHTPRPSSSPSLLSPPSTG